MCLNLGLFYYEYFFFELSVKRVNMLSATPIFKASEDIHLILKFCLLNYKLSKANTSDMDFERNIAPCEKIWLKFFYTINFLNYSWNSLENVKNCCK